MIFIADFHIHSKYSRATSSQMDLEHLEKAAQVKGITVLGSGDFTHPVWMREIKEKMEPVESGLFALKSKIQNPKERVRFILTSEISCIYSKGGKVRKIHLLVFAPDIDSVVKINSKLSRIGNLKADGRPILGLDAKELLKIVLDVSSECLVVPGHCWTPWFSVFGSKSGFDSIEECFEDYAPYIFALETGLSSDPAMNWRLSALDKKTLISCSDAHSPRKLGREACVFDAKLSYSAIIGTLKTKNPENFLRTIEFFPEEGKYHYDGHRLCRVSFSPEQTKKNHGLCPVCSRPLTIGVLHRVEELSDRPVGFKLPGAIPFLNLVPLEEIIAEVAGVGVASKAVALEYQKLIQHFGTEFNVLLNASHSEIEAIAMPDLAQAIILTREGKVRVEPGYDGEYGKVKIFDSKRKRSAPKQRALFDLELRNVQDRDSP